MATAIRELRAELLGLPAWVRHGSVLGVLWMFAGLIAPRTVSRFLLAMGLTVGAMGWAVAAARAPGGARPMRIMWAAWVGLGAILYFALSVFDPLPSTGFLGLPAGTWFRLWPYLLVPLIFATVAAACRGD